MASFYRFRHSGVTCPLDKWKSGTGRDGGESGSETGSWASVPYRGRETWDACAQHLIVISAPAPKVSPTIALPPLGTLTGRHNLILIKALQPPL
jgi:hypothetical protein